jgi:putative transposase
MSPPHSSRLAIRDWPHAPIHRLSEAGVYMVTSGTYQKAHLFQSAERLTFLTNMILKTAEDYGCRLQAWAAFSNHYHLILETPQPARLQSFVKQLHTTTARYANDLDQAANRKVWFQYWESHLTFQNSYISRLNYVHSNAMLHGLVRRPDHYPWCSAIWFERKAPKSFQHTVMSFPCDKLNVPDNFECKKVGQAPGL